MSVHVVRVSDDIEGVLQRFADDSDVIGVVPISLRPRSGGGKVEIATGLAHLFDRHVARIVEVVDDSAAEAPLISKDGGEEAVVAASPLQADTVEGGHDT